jgi:hypothetical protein
MSSKNSSTAVLTNAIDFSRAGLFGLECSESVWISVKSPRSGWYVERSTETALGGLGIFLARRRAMATNRHNMLGVGLRCEGFITFCLTTTLGFDPIVCSPPRKA